MLCSMISLSSLFIIFYRQEQYKTDWGLDKEIFSFSNNFIWFLYWLHHAETIINMFDMISHFLIVMIKGFLAGLNSCSLWFYGFHFEKFHYWHIKWHQDSFRLNILLIIGTINTFRSSDSFCILEKSFYFAIAQLFLLVDRPCTISRALTKDSLKIFHFELYGPKCTVMSLFECMRCFTLSSTIIWGRFYVAMRIVRS